ncbi:DUF1207 domain-containing protein [Petrachloros mirabilis]
MAPVALPMKRLKLSPFALAACLFLLVSVHQPLNLAAADDSYIAGYAAALLEREFRLSAAIHVKNGVVTVYMSPSVHGDRHKIIRALRTIAGVERVELVESERPESSPPDETVVVDMQVASLKNRLFPQGLLFEPLHADPRWPHFSGAYRSRISGVDPDRAFAGNFGETFALYRDNAPFHGQWEFGLQAGVFSFFDVGAPSGSQDLINADYTIGMMASYRTGPISAFLRIQHLSAHLGDEYLLNNPSHIPRLGLSYEEVDAKLSYEVFGWLRLYGGGGYLFDTDPSDLKPGTSQFGVEFQYPDTFLSDLIRPVAYADFQANQRTGWSIGNSLMAGIRLEHFTLMDRNIQILFEYYSGPSPNGDFLFQRTQWVGVGVHFYL